MAVIEVENDLATKMYCDSKYNLVLVQNFNRTTDSNHISIGYLQHCVVTLFVFNTGWQD